MFKVKHKGTGEIFLVCGIRNTESYNPEFLIWDVIWEWKESQLFILWND